MKEPTGCIFWKEPEAISSGTMKERFERVETFVDTSHWWRYLLKCRECGQLYFFEFYEKVDWVDGEDPQFSTYIPVETGEDIDRLKEASLFGLLDFFPRLHRDFPKGAKTPKVFWVKRKE